MKIISTDMPDMEQEYFEMWESIQCEGKSFYQSYIEWIFSPDGYRKTEPRSDLSHLIKRIDGFARRKATKLPRKLKKKKQIQPIMIYTPIYPELQSRVLKLTPEQRIILQHALSLARQNGLSPYTDEIFSCWMAPVVLIKNKK